MDSRNQARRLSADRLHGREHDGRGAFDLLELDGEDFRLRPVLERKGALRQEKRLFVQLREPIFVWELDGDIIEWNRGCEERYGYKRGEAIGKPREKLFGSTGGSTFEEVKSELLKTGHWTANSTNARRTGASSRLRAGFSSNPSMIEHSG